MFAAVFGPGSLAVDRHALIESINPFDQADVTGHRSVDGGLFVQTTVRNSIASQLEDGPHHDADSGRTIVGWIRLDNRAELAEQLGIDTGGLETMSDPMLVAAAYAHWGSDCVERLVGDYSFVLHDARRRQVFAARDPFGVRPLFVAVGDDGTLAFATTAAAFRVLDSIELEPSADWMARYIVGQSMSHTVTPWVNVTKVPGGHRVQVDLGADSAAGGAPRIDVERWHEFVDDAPQEWSLDERWLEAYRSTLWDAVGNRLNSVHPIGIETSGGIDSSTCVGVAADVLGDRRTDIHTFGLVTHEKEHVYVPATGALHGLQANEFLFTTDVAGSGQAIVTHDGHGLGADLEREFTVLGYPGEHSNGASYDGFYRLAAARGVRTLLSGFGGDEGVTNPAAPVRLEYIDNQKWRLLYADMAGRWWRKIPALLKNVWDARPGGTKVTPLDRAVAERTGRLLIDEDLVSRLGLDERRLFADGFRTVNEFVLGNRINEAFVPTRLECCSLMAQSRKVEYRWPLLAPALVQQYLSTPSVWKRWGGTGRYLHRRAIEGVVPAFVQWKPGKEMGEPDRGDVDVANRPIPPGLIERLDDLDHRIESIVDRKRIDALLSPADETGARTAPLDVVRQLRAIVTLDDWLRLLDPVSA